MNYKPVVFSLSIDVRVNNASLQHWVEEDALQQHMTRDKTDAQRVEPKRKREKKRLWFLGCPFYYVG